jgi:hypothetical protein
MYGRSLADALGDQWRHRAGVPRRRSANAHADNIIAAARLHDRGRSNISSRGLSIEDCLSVEEE